MPHNLLFFNFERRSFERRSVFSGVFASFYRSLHKICTVGNDVTAKYLRRRRHASFFLTPTFSDIWISIAFTNPRLSRVIWYLLCTPSQHTSVKCASLRVPTFIMFLAWVKFSWRGEACDLKSVCTCLWRRGRDCNRPLILRGSSRTSPTYFSVVALEVDRMPQR